MWRIRTFAFALVTCLVLCLGLLGGCSPPQAPVAEKPATPVPPGTPELVVMLAVDQLPASYLVRFRPLLTGGLEQLLEEAVFFADTHHAHAYTATAPGHATLVTGVHPARHGVIANGWLDRERGEEVEAVDDEEFDKSPRQLLVTSLGDWLQETWPQARVFAASGKDRGAIFSGGLHADGAWWFDRSSGEFVSSAYYFPKERPAPAWLEEFNGRRLADAAFGQPWVPLEEVRTAPAQMGIEPVAFGPVPDTFPHALGGLSLEPGESFYRDVYGSPLGDALLLDLAEALVAGEKLGEGPAPDLLALSFSSLDAVGHHYGPDSPEVLDTLLRLDRGLGDFFAFLDQRLGLENVLISLSSDHGVVPLPEVLARRGHPTARRVGTEEVECFQQAGRAFADLFGPGWWLGDGYLDRGKIESEGQSAVAMESEARRLLEACPGVARVWTASELASGEAVSGAEPEPVAAGGGDAGDRFDAAAYFEAYRHGFHPERSADVIFQVAPYVLTSRSSTTSHGTPYEYDTHVPWLLRLPAEPGQGGGRLVGERVHTVDVAPTVAAFLGLTVPADLDGVDRGSSLGRE